MISRDKLDAERAAVGQIRASEMAVVTNLWEDDFSGDWTNPWTLDWLGVDQENNVSFKRDGEAWLRVNYLEGRVGRGFKFMTEGLVPQDRAYLQHKGRFAEDFDWVLGGKLPGFLEGNVRAGVRPNGTGGWSVRFMWRENDEGMVYTYHPDMAGIGGEDLRLENFWFQNGVTHTIGLELLFNTPGQRDGSIRARLDGVLVVEETGMRFRDIQGLEMDGLVFSTFFGGNKPKWAPTKEQHIDFGEFKLYQAPPWEGEKRAAADSNTPRALTKARGI